MNLVELDKVYNLFALGGVPVHVILNLLSETAVTKSLPMSAKKRVLTHIQAHPGQSATQIAKALKLKASSVSSLLNECSKYEALRRVPGRGPRGGYVYYSLDYQHPHPTRFDRIYFAKS